MTDTVTVSQETTASPSSLWQVLGDDFFGIASWASAVHHSSPMTAAPAGMGASRRVQAAGMVLLENVVDWKPDVALAYELAGLPPVVSRVENRWELTSIHNDVTSVSLTCAVDPGPKPPMKAAAKVVARRLAKTNESLVADLIARVEAADKERES